MAEDIIFWDEERSYFVGFVVPPREGDDVVAVMNTNHSSQRFSAKTTDLLLSLSVSTSPAEFISVMEKSGGSESDYTDLVKANRVITLPRAVTPKVFDSAFAGKVLVSLNANQATVVDDEHVVYQYVGLPSSRIVVSKLVYDFLSVSEGDTEIQRIISQLAGGDLDVEYELEAQILNALPIMISNRYVALLDVE